KRQPQNGCSAKILVHPFSFVGLKKSFGKAVVFGIVFFFHLVGELKSQVLVNENGRQVGVVPLSIANDHPVPGSGGQPYGKEVNQQEDGYEFGIPCTDSLHLFIYWEERC